MKKTRKLISVLLVLLLTAGIIIIPFEADAADGKISLGSMYQPYDGVCGDFAYAIKKDNTAELVMYLGNDTDIVLPSEVDGYTVTEFMSSIFESDTNVVSVTLPETITILQAYSFQNVKNIKKLYYNCIDATLDERLFNYCGKDSLEVVIGNKVKSIPDHAFHGTGITEINIPNSVERIGKFAFDYTKLSSINIPETVKYIGDNNRRLLFLALQNASLNNVVIPDGVGNNGAQRVY